MRRCQNGEMATRITEKQPRTIGSYQDDRQSWNYSRYVASGYAIPQVRNIFQPVSQ
ncbi:unnamed protein product, partial [Staurois parvus]